MVSTRVAQTPQAGTATTPPASLAKWLGLSVLVAAAMLVVAYGRLMPHDPLGDARPSATCSDCVGNTADPGTHGNPSAGGQTPEGRGSMGSRIVRTIQGLFAALDASLREVVAPGSETSEDAALPCGRGIHDPPHCGGSGRTGYERRLADRPSPAAPAGGSLISGRILDAAGLGIGGVQVTLVAVGSSGDSHAEERRNTPRPVATTDDLGYYEFRGLRDGDYEIRTAATEAYGPRRMAARSGLRNADIVLVGDRSVVVEGEVLGVAGERLAAVTVLPVVVGAASVQTDAFGAYRLEVPLQPGLRSLSIRYQLAGFLDQTVAVDMSGRPGLGSLPLDVKLQPVESWTSVAGVVTDAGGAPLAGRSVSLRKVGGQQSYRTTTDRRGRYSFDAVEAPVSYQLDVSGAPDHEDYRRRIDVSTRAARFDVAVEPFEFGTVSGRLVNADGAPVTNFSLVVRNKASAAPNAVVSSDAAGNFRVERAPAGELTVASQSSPSILVRGLRLAAGDELDLPLVIDWGEHELRGVVVDQNDNPVPASRVLLTWTRVENGVTATTTRRARSDAQGVFYFDNLGPGPHLLQVESPGRRPVKVTHDISRQGYFVRVGV